MVGKRSKGIYLNKRSGVKFRRWPDVSLIIFLAAPEAELMVADVFLYIALDHITEADKGILTTTYCPGLPYQRTWESDVKMARVDSNN